MGFINDILPIFKKHKLVLKDKRQETGDIKTFIFEAQEKFWWKPGRHGMVYVKTLSGKIKGKPFSVASAPEEGEIIISTRVSKDASEYKRGLDSLQLGDTVTMNGPIGPFHLEDKTKQVLLIGGGVGITPIRAIIFSEILNKNSKVPMQLLFIDSKKEFLYKEEFDAASENNDFVKIKYLTERGELSDELAAYLNEFGNDSYYFISGSPQMVKELKNYLKSKGISRKNIKSDVFFGY
jgi:NAD(P)H-flavin reductase